jgi:hypothetical protein
MELGVGKFSNSGNEFEICRATQTSILILVDTKNDYGKVLWCFQQDIGGYYIFKFVR